ncbi:MAG: hypothetical protein ACOYJL_07825 [Tractidigestivibacter sp.]|jgi:hypothetical protein|uniref:hypothetical protein n=1 Tax=Tractidigestivibacter sp. TaxID=2847320 RepID=UPI003D92DFD0
MTSRARHATASALRVLRIIARVLAFALLALTVVNVLDPEPLHATLRRINGALTLNLPSQIAGVLVVSTPLGGALRGDYVLLAVILLVVGWVLKRGANALEFGPSRGE